jgi:hypothetical protein
MIGKNEKERRVKGKECVRTKKKPTRREKGEVRCQESRRRTG